MRLSLIHEEHRVSQRAKRVYTIDAEPYLALIAEFLEVASRDSNYAVAVSKQATTILAKRRKFETDDQ